MKAAYAKWTQLNKNLSIYFNPVGEFYIKFFLIGKIIPVNFLLDGDWSDKGKLLSCETAQVGCNLVCENRYAPILHMKLWSFEMFIVTLITAIFGLFNYYNKKRYEAYKKKTDQDNQLKKYVTLNYQSERRMKDVTTIAKDNGHRMFTVESRRGGKVQKITSPYTATGYLFMLLLRFTMEFFFVVFEVTLAMHQSQNGNWSEAFELKEYWHCLSNSDAVHAYEEGKIQETILPETNRTLWHREDVNHACTQQAAAVKCWIPYSRMKKLVLYSMFYILCIQLFLTFCEICFELMKLRKKERYEQEVFRAQRSLKN